MTKEPLIQHMDTVPELLNRLKKLKKHIRIFKLSQEMLRHMKQHVHFLKQEQTVLK